MPPDPPRVFFVSQSASNLFRRKNNTLKKMWKLCPPFKISRYATDLVSKICVAYFGMVPCEPLFIYLYVHTAYFRIFNNFSHAESGSRLIL